MRILDLVTYDCDHVTLIAHDDQNDALVGRLTMCEECEGSIADD
jgi:hypothetical protein